MAGGREELEKGVNSLFLKIIGSHSAYHGAGGSEAVVKRDIRALCERLQDIFDSTVEEKYKPKPAEFAQQNGAAKEDYGGDMTGEELKEARNGLKDFFKGYERYKGAGDKGREKKVGAYAMLEARLQVCYLLARSIESSLNSILSAPRVSAAAAAAGLSPIRAPSVRAGPSRPGQLEAVRRGEGEGDETPPWGYNMSNDMYERLLRLRSKRGRMSNNGNDASNNDNGSNSPRTLEYEGSNSNDNDNAPSTPRSQIIRPRNSPPRGPSRLRRTKRMRPNNSGAAAAAGHKRGRSRSRRARRV